MNKVSIGHPSSHYQHKPTIWTSYQLPGVFIWYCTIFHDIPMDSHLSSINYLQLSSNIINYHLSSLIYHHLLYIICHLPSTIIYRPSSIVYHLTSIIDPLSYIIYHLSSIINHLSSIINHHSSFISHHHHHHHHHHHLLIRWAWNCCTSAAGWPSSLAPRVDGSGTIRHLLVWSSLPSLRPWYASDTQTHTLTAWHAKWGPCAIGPTLKKAVTFWWSNFSNVGQSPLLEWYHKCCFATGFAWNLATACCQIWGFRLCFGIAPWESTWILVKLTLQVFCFLPLVLAVKINIKFNVGRWLV